MRALLASAIVVGTVLVAGCDSDTEVVEPTAEPSAPKSPTTTLSTHPSATTIFATVITATETATHTPNPVLLSELTRNKEKWATAGITNYQFRFDFSCFCPREGFPTTIVVHDNELQSVTDASGIIVTSGIPYDLSSPYSTAESIFELIETNLSIVDSITVTYSDNGFPEEINIDALLHGADDEAVIMFSDFEVLQ